MVAGSPHDENNKGTNWLLFGAAMFFIIIIVIGIIATGVSDAMNKAKTLTPGPGNSLKVAGNVPLAGPVGGNVPGA